MKGRAVYHVDNI